MIEPRTSTRSSIEHEIAALGHWFHNLHLPDGTQTAPDHPLGDFPSYKWKRLSAHLPQNLQGWKVLDIGCNAGFYSIELARRGATVLGIDRDTRYLAQAHWAAKQFKLKAQITFRNMHVYDLARMDESFDLVLFMGVFYHLRYPTLALDIVSQRVRRMMVFQTLTIPGDEVYEMSEALNFENREVMREAGWPRMAFIEGSFANDPTNWWVPNHAGVEAMIRASGMRVSKAIGHEIYLCEPDPEHPSVITTWNRDEFCAATGSQLLS